jgi:hypothetical protein
MHDPLINSSSDPTAPEPLRLYRDLRARNQREILRARLLEARRRQRIERLVEATRRHMLRRSSDRA